MHRDLGHGAANFPEIGRVHPPRVEGSVMSPLLKST
jgi:hypothetical protein